MFIVDLDNEMAVIEISGADSSTYLQGQLTNDIKILDNQPFQYAAHLNNKGRMLATFIITKVAENTYHLITHKKIIEKILPKLKMYILRSKVTIQILENIHLIYSNCAIENARYNLPLDKNNFLSLTDTTPNVQAKDTKHWHGFLINQGIAFIYPETFEQLIPEQTNFDLIGGVNFKKGCYTGQEIVARMHYLGKAKQRMYRFISDTEAKIGQSVISPKINNQEVGIIVDLVKREYDYLGLVSLKNDYIDDAFILDNNNLPHQLLVQEFIFQENNG